MGFHEKESPCLTIENPQKKITTFVARDWTSWEQPSLQEAIICPIWRSKTPKIIKTILGMKTVSKTEMNNNFQTTKATTFSYNKLGKPHT